MKRPGFSYQMLLLVAWSALILAADYVVINTTAKQALATRYRPVTAKIVESEIGHGAIRQSGVLFEYNYTVNKVDYTGTRFRYDDRNAAYEYADATNTYPRWSETTVFYNPNDPADSVMDPGVDGSDLLLLLFAAPMNIITCALWTAALPLLRKNRQLGPAGGVKVWTARGETRARLAEFSPAGVGWFALAAACFVAAFPVISFFGFAPPMRLMLRLWVGVGVARVAAWAWTRQRNLSGVYDLRIQPATGTVILPMLAGRDRPLTITRQEISGVSLLAHVTRNPSGTHVSYVPALTCHAQPLKLARWGWNQARARAFGLWLSQELRVEFKGEVQETA